MSEIIETGGLSHKQRMLAGLPYHADDPELVAEFARAHRLAAAYSLIDPGERGAQEVALRELLGSLGEDCEVRAGLRLELGYNLYLGHRVFVNFDVTFLDIAEIRIGDDTLIGPNVNILTPTHPTDPRARREKWEAAKPITLGRNVWLGGNVTICPGVTIGDDTTVGAGSVVVHDLPPRVVAVGNPAHIVKMLPPQDTPGPEELAMSGG
jgi:maltose O-acetyltransferase